VTGALAPVIGLEVHAQLQTRSKMFCGCSAEYANAPPNTHVCNVCSGMPGSLPVANQRAVEYTLLTALALGCEIPPVTKFDRKNYSYPDLPKGYQISQYDQPIGKNGVLEFVSGGTSERCGVIRVHLEEDTGKSTHGTIDGRGASLVDYNRSGVPLMEIVSAPDLRTPETARDYFATLRQVLMYLGVCDGNLQEGSMRADVNVSLRLPDGSFGTKVEIKNLNSFRAVQRALEYEIVRQREVLASGGTIEQETRGWSEPLEVTVGQRSKEYAHDYRYFPEPDLPPLAFTPSEMQAAREQLPEMPARRAARFIAQYGVTPATAAVLIAERALADFYEAAAEASERGSGTDVANWIAGDLLRLINESHVDIDEVALSPQQLGRLVSLVKTGVVSNAAGKQVLEVLFESGEDPDSIINRLDLGQLSDTKELEQVIDRVLLENQSIVADYRKGKVAAVNVLLGKTMKASGGKANPGLVRELLTQKLGAPGT
jgi:aspartyl-tRNA(Asn)/glutamyl-tRNA(Gln) amidotransferase subunit B